jgi:hypothetical protein
MRVAEVEALYSAAQDEIELKDKAILEMAEMLNIVYFIEISQFLSLITLREVG